MIVCNAPDVSLGVAVRLATTLDCQARALGENGFQLLAGGPLIASLLSGLVTIFVALIGYRLILGSTPDLRDGIGWTVRLGIVLTLVTSWPAFETLIYRVVVNGPNEVAALLMPAAGLPSDSLDARVQSAYDKMRQGALSIQVDVPANGQSSVSGAPSQATNPLAPNQLAPNQIQLRTPGRAGFPQTASALVLASTGVIAALRMTIGFLLAIGPLVLLSLLFEATSSVAAGWGRVLAGAAITLSAATIVTAAALLSIEAELAHEAAFFAGTIAPPDEQAVPTIVMLFALIQFVTLVVVGRMLSIVLPGQSMRDRGGRSLIERVGQIASTARPNAPVVQAQRLASPAQTRVASVAGALAQRVRFEQAGPVAQATSTAGLDAPRRTAIVEAAQGVRQRISAEPLGSAARRGARRSRSARARDQ